MFCAVIANIYKLKFFENIHAIVEKMAIVPQVFQNFMLISRNKSEMLSKKRPGTSEIWYWSSARRIETYKGTQ